MLLMINFVLFSNPVTGPVANDKVVKLIFLVFVFLCVCVRVCLRASAAAGGSTGLNLSEPSPLIC